MTVGFDGLNSFAEREAVIESPLLTCVSMLLDVEAVATGPVEAGERRVELLAKVVRKVGTAALYEAVLSAALFAEDIEGVVELGRSDLEQEQELREVGDQVFARCGDAGLLGFGECCFWLSATLAVLTRLRSRWALRSGGVSYAVDAPRYQGWPA